MDPDYYPEKERIFLLLKEAGKSVLQEILKIKLFCLFLNKNQDKIKTSLRKSEVEEVFSPDFVKKSFIDSLKNTLLLRTIIDIGAKDVIRGSDCDVDTMRHIIVHKVMPSTLHSLVLEKETKLRKIKKTSVPRDMFENLFSQEQDISKLDIALVCFLLFNVFNIKPTNGFKDFPQEQHTKEGDDILRLRLYRNQLCHDEKIEASSTWKGIYGAIIRLANERGDFHEKIREIKTKCIDENTKQQYEKVIQLWKEQQAQDIEDLQQFTKETIEKQTKEVEDIIKKHKECSTVTIKNAIKEYTEETQQKLEQLMYKYREEFRTCMAAVREGETQDTNVKIGELLQNMQQDLKDQLLEIIKKMSNDIETQIAGNLEEGMKNLQDKISTKNDTFMNIFQESISNLGEEIKRSQKKVVKAASEKNESMVKNNLEQVEERLKTAVEKKADNNSKRTEEIMHRFEEFEKKLNDQIDKKIAMAKTNASTASGSSSDENDESKIKKLKVTKLPESATKENLKSFFKSKKKSGGGQIGYINIEKARNQAIIVFKKPSDASRVLQRKPHVFQDQPIFVEIYDSDNETEEEEAFESDGSKTGIEEVLQTDATPGTWNIMLKIYRGDITDVEVDAIVSPTNASFDLKNDAVSQAVKTKGGDELKKQISSKRKHMAEGGVAVTSGGNLPCRHLIHVNTEERTTNSIISQINKALREANDNGNIKTIAFPVSGNWLGPSVEEVAFCFFEALSHFWNSGIRTSFKEVYIVIPEEDMKQRIAEDLKNFFQDLRGVIMETDSSWSFTYDVELDVISLQTSKTEFKKVKEELLKTITTPLIGLTVKRVENRSLHEGYFALKTWMIKKNPPNTQNERLLWYGTTKSDIESINRFGFVREFNRQDGTELGHGVYFTVDAKQSTFPGNIDSDGNYTLYLCSVLTGEYTKGTSQLSSPPQNPNSAAGYNFDSVVNNEDDPKTFAIFDHTQAYPKYLLTFK